jgi:hypothetical protein
MSWESFRMTICYRLTRAEVLRVFFFSLAKSPRILTIVVIVSAGPGFIWLYSRRAFSNGLQIGDIRSAVGGMASALCLLTLWIFLRAKTGERTLTISSLGILTSISRLRGEVPWARVKEVRDTGNYLLVVGHLVTPSLFLREPSTGRVIGISFWPRSIEFADMREAARLSRLQSSTR